MRFCAVFWLINCVEYNSKILLKCNAGKRFGYKNMLLASLI